MASLCIAKFVLKCRSHVLRDNLSVCHANVCSLFPKINYVREIVSESNLNVICISETWLSKLITDQAVRIDGYHLIRHDRCVINKRSSSGGVCVYLSTGFRYKVVAKSDSASRLEYLFIEVEVPSHSHILIGVVYNPPDSRNLDGLYHIIDNLCVNYFDVIITGDFNVNVCNSTTASEDLRQQLLSCDLSIVSSAPTHFKPHCIPSCLDLFVTNEVGKVKCFDQVGLHFTHHDLIFISYDIPLESSSTPPVSFRNYNRIQLDNLISDVAALPWHNILYMTEVDD